MSKSIVVVITGASSGIGKTLALHLARKPAEGPVDVVGASYKLMLAARREEELKAAVAECDAVAGASVAAYFVADVTRESDVVALAKAAVDKFGRIDVWVNNAGRGIVKSTLELSDADIDDMMTVNVKSALYGMRAAVNVMKTQSPAGGQIVNVNSLLGRNAAVAPFRSAYSGAKHFLNAITDAAREDLRASEATKGITVSNFLPGPVSTDFGLNANGPDSRANPHSQDVEEVAALMRKQIESKVEELYSSEWIREAVVRFIGAKGAPTAPSN